MSTQDIPIDAEIYARTASRFARKRDMFEPGAVETLASDIMRYLTRAAAQAPRFDDPVIDEASLSAFCDALVAAEPKAALDFISERRAAGLTRQAVYIGYVVAAARKLGEEWDAGRLSFTQVTIGSGHLYALMRALRAEAPSPAMAVDARRHAMFATVPGETHGIGVTVAADLFREAGWDIDLQMGKSREALMRRAEATEPRIVGLSLSTERRLPDLVRLVVALRVSLPHAIIGVAPGAELSDASITDLVDIDLLFHDARHACADLDRLIRLQG